MPSHLRLQSTFSEPIAVHATIQQTSPTLPPKKKQRMSLTQTYYVASTARSKLGREAGRADHNLRLLVGHANLLDSLMLELQNAEREQEAWFNQSVRTAAKTEEPRHVQWIDTIPEMDDESDSDDESEEDEEEYQELAPRRSRSPVPYASAPVFDDEEDEDEDMEYDAEYDDGELSLTRVASKHSPPELTMDSDSEEEESSEDEDECPSPEDISLELSEKQRQQIATTALFDKGLEDYALAAPGAGLITAAC